VHKLIAQL